MAHRTRTGIGAAALMLVLLLAACGQSTATPAATSAPAAEATAPAAATAAPEATAEATAPAAEATAPAAEATAPASAATDLGTEANPIKMAFVPSAEAAKVLTNGDKIAAALEKATGLKFKTSVPTNYAAVIEAMGSEEADVAWLATFAYVLAHEKNGAEVALTTTRSGLETYKGEIIARADSGIKTIDDCNGKKVAWVDPASASGYVYPSALFAQKGIKPSAETFAGGHPQAVLAVYDGSVDCAATYYTPPAADGTIADGRATALKTYPDAGTALVIIGNTVDIPNDTVSFRKDFPADMRDKIVAALLDYSTSDEGKQTLKDLYNITGFVKSDDSRYTVVREALEALGKSPDDFVK